MNTYIESTEAVTGYEIFENAFSVILPEETTNLCTNPSLENGTTGYTAYGGASIARSVTYAWMGSHSLQVTPAAGADCGAYWGTFTATAGTAYTASAYLRGKNGQKYRVYITDNAGARIGAYKEVTATRQAWLRLHISLTDYAGGTRRVYVEKVSSTDTTPFYIDCMQIEAKAYVTTYCDGDCVPMLAGRMEYLWNGVPHASTSYRLGDSRAGGREVMFEDLKLKVMGVVGLGHPPVENIAQDLNGGGAIYQNTIARPREFTLVCDIEAETISELFSRRQELLWAFSPLYPATRQPIKLGYRSVMQYETEPPLDDIAYQAEYISVCYVGGLDGNIDNYHKENISLNFIEYQPESSERWIQLMELNPSAYISPADYCLRINNMTGVVENLHATAPNGAIYCMTEAPDGTIIFGGNFTSIGGVAANYIARYDPVARTFSALGAGTNGAVRCVAIDSIGRLYVGGDFTQAGGAAANYIARWDGAAWAAYIVGANNGTNGSVYAATIYGSTGSFLAIGGAFTTAGGLAVNRVAYRAIVAATTSAWSAIGTGVNGQVNDIVTDNSRNSIWVVGAFTQANGVAANQVCQIHVGLTYSYYNAGMPTLGAPTVVSISIAPNGTKYIAYNNGVSGSFLKNSGGAWQLIGGPSWVTAAAACVHVKRSTGEVLTGYTPIAGDPKYAEGFSIFNGSTFVPPVFDRPGATAVNEILYTQNYTYLAYGDTGIALATGYLSTKLRHYSNIRFEVHGPGYLRRLHNKKADKNIWADYKLADGEVATLNLEAGGISFNSNLLGNVISKIVTPSQLSGWQFNNYNDNFGAFFTANWTETGDTNNQLSDYQFITFVCFANTDNHKIYVSVIADGGGFYHVAGYKDAARTALIFHTATYNSTGYKTVVADNASGMGGAIKVDAVTAACVTIEVQFGYIYMLYAPKSFEV